MEMVSGANDGAGDECWSVPVPNLCDEDPLLASGSHYWTQPIHESSLQQPAAAKEALVDIEKMVSKATQRFESQVSMKLNRIHRFPQQLRGLGGPHGRYVVPSVVAIGPYHHGLPHLQKMEEVKNVAAYQICRDMNRSVSDVYEKILSITGDARRCYIFDDEMSLVARLSDADFATMMFLDGCFLLKFMMCDEPPITGHELSCWPTIAKDTLLLENQIPLLVLEALVECFPVQLQDFPVQKLVPDFIDGVNEVYFFDRKETENLSCITWLKLQNFLTKCRRDLEERTNTDESKPPHLLGLLRLHMIRDMPSKEKREGTWTPNSLLWLSSSAVYLAQKGVKLTGNRTRCFADIKVEKNFLFGELSLSPLFLNEIVACILVNLVGLEAAQATDALNDSSDGLVVSSYLSILAMLMDREEDVQQLRGRGVLCSHFSNKQTLDFFKGIMQHLRLGYNYFAIVQEIDDYMRKRPFRTFIHKFVYKNFKLIAAVMSIASVLVGVFKALYSLKHSYSN